MRSAGSSPARGREQLEIEGSEDRTVSQGLKGPMGVDDRGVADRVRVWKAWVQIQTNGKTT